VVDTGHGRVLSVDPSTATPGGKIEILEVLQASGLMDGATTRELVRPGTLQKPSGIALSGSTLYVTDNATSKIHVFDRAGTALRVLDTAMPKGSLAGITIGPDGKPYITDLQTGNVERVEATSP
jgi:sugar lactone lactonase YvrE